MLSCCDCVWLGQLCLIRVVVLGYCGCVLVRVVVLGFCFFVFLKVVVLGCWACGLR